MTSKPLNHFASACYPLHPSEIREVLDCPWRIVMSYLSSGEGDEGGQAADTGSAMHVAAAAYHKQKGVAESIEEMQAGIAKYPKADMTDAANLFLAYAADPRNSTCEFLLVEAAITFSIAPAPEDETQAPIVVTGTVDQVRLINGIAKVWDIKTSKKPPMEVLLESTFQLACYTLGASIALNRMVQPGGIVMPRQYKGIDMATAPVFWHASFGFDDLERLLSPLRSQVAKIRKGVIHHVPSAANCKYCPARGPDVCLPQLKKVSP